MKVLLIKPMEHPQVVDIENSLKEFYRILDCDCITATYPWEERAAPYDTRGSPVIRRPSPASCRIQRARSSAAAVFDAHA